MAKKNKRIQQSSMDLRRRTTIVVETPDIEKMSQTDLIRRIQKLNMEYYRIPRSRSDLDFMIDAPQRRAIIRMKKEIKQRLTLKKC